MEEESEASPGWNSVSTTDLPTTQGQRLSNLRKVSGSWAQDKNGSGPLPHRGVKQEHGTSCVVGGRNTLPQTGRQQTCLKSPEEAGGVMNHILEDGQLFLGR